MATRLDRLISLLESGSSQAVRFAAAKQVGELAKYHPDEIHSLLARICTLLRNKTWETRVAASQAVACISSNVPQYKPSPEDEKLFQENAKPSSLLSAPLLRFANFSMESVLAKGTLLLASEHTSAPHMDKVTMDFEDVDLCMVEKDIIGATGMKNKKYGASKEKKSPESAVPKNLSAREKYLMKKERKVKEQQHKRKEIEVKDESAVATKRMKTVVTEQPQTEQKLVIESVVDKQATVQHDKWPFYLFTEQFKQDLTSPNWEIRHGAALGLKSVLQHHATSAGKTIHVTELERGRQNDCWLEDCCIRLLRIFALDRFADFISDQVVCPVREACAQTLGILLLHVKPDVVQKTINSLLILVKQEQWEVRYGGLLGLKYAVAVRQDVINNQLPHILDVVVPSLNFSIDDVRSVAADTLHPIAEHIVRLAFGKLKQIRDILWDILLDLDDLSAATSSVMKLLAKFYILASNEQAGDNKIFFSDDLATLVPRLWPFLRHNLLTVRRAAIEMLELITAPESSKKWLLQILPEILRYMFQNVILESKVHIVQATQRVWKQIIKHVPTEALLKVTCTFFPSWINLLSTTQGASLDIALLLLPTSIKEAMQDYKGASKQSPTISTKKKKGRASKNLELAASKSKRTAETMTTNGEEGDEIKSFDIRISIEDTEEYTSTKIAGSSALSFLIQQLLHNQPLQSLQTLFDTIKLLLDSQWAVHRQVAGLIIQGLFCTEQSDLKKFSLPSEIMSKLLALVATQDQASYNELQPSYAAYINECNSYLQYLMGFGIDVTPYVTNQSVTFEHTQELTTKMFDTVSTLIGDNQPAITELLNKRNRVQSSVEFYKNSIVQTGTTTIGTLCCAVAEMSVLPADEYLLFVVNGLMSSIQREKKSLTMQQRSAESLAHIVHNLRDKHAALNEQITTNLIYLLCTTLPSEEDEKQQQQQQGEDIQNVTTDTFIIQRGSSMALCKIVEALGAQVFEEVPCLWDQSGNILYSEESKVNNSQKITHALHIIKTIIPPIHPDLYEKLEHLLNNKLLGLTADPLGLIAVHAAKTIAVLCKVFTSKAMKVIFDKLIPLLSDPKHVLVRQGAVRTLTMIVNTLEMDILPYVVLFTVPLLKRMSDQDQLTREMASNCFGNVIKILPLERSVHSIPELEPLRERERRFVDQLLDNSKVESYEMKIKVNADLRQYQKDGISWLAFLNKFNLHGILCDDMGLGKTLQTLCILASDIEERRQMYKSTQLPEYIHLPSLVVCPPTLVGHWFYEIKKFCPDLSPIQYIGNPQARKSIRSEISKHDVIIMSYDVLRNDVDLISTNELGDTQIYNYCVLDEGHIIKNSKTKVTKAVKRVPANHRLILSGTPIQNNVLELWSLFDFLMPGFLGTEKEFNQKYGKPILASKDSKANSKEHEAGALALEALHRQVLPFLLRRVKEDVLHDLPEKIIQDYYCELSPLQWRLYEDFSKKHLPSELEDAQDLREAKKNAALHPSGNVKKEGEEPKWHIFQALQYLRKLCNHPLLILNENHPEYLKVMRELEDQKKNLHEISFSPKLQALKELLNQCGLGLKKSKSLSYSGSNAAASSGGEDGSLEAPSAAGHRVLVFAQLKSMLDIIEEDLFKKHMPNLTFMRLDGTVESSKRHALVTKFNSDPTIDVLLLTTHVGGLGLNLTGADTVIFVEHDWNPSADLQAMDRAHRIGQKRVVNVYRLITRNTLEEKIMGLQKFKMNIQKSIVTRENSSLKSMDTAQLVDLFKLGEEKKEAARKQEGSSSGAPSALLKDIGELWDTEKQYEEFNLDSFMKSMIKK